MEINGAPALGISFQCEVEPGRTIVFQTHFDAAISEEDLNKLVDKLGRVSDRQMAKFSIVKLKKQLEAHERRIQDNKELDAEALEKAQEEYSKAGRRGEYRPTQAQESARTQRFQAIRKDEEEIKKIKELIADCEAVIEPKPKPKIAA